MATFDFGMDSFVAVEAPEGTDPDTLHTQAIELFKERLASGDIVLEFLGNPDLGDEEEVAVNPPVNDGSTAWPLK